MTNSNKANQSYSKRKIAIYKNNEFVTVYRNKMHPNKVYKVYYYVPDIDEIYEFLEKREKMLSIMDRQYWPDFLVKPTSVSDVKISSGNAEPYTMKKDIIYFTVELPWVMGTDLSKYIKAHDIDILTCANLIKDLENIIYGEKNFVFTDIANPGNIIVTSKSNKSLNFKIIDVDEIQFDEYFPRFISKFISPIFEDDKIFGMRKCVFGDFCNKQLDIRSIYALLYFIMNGGQCFYPAAFERKSLSEYEKILREFNIPENSSLYENTMLTLSDDENSKPIGQSLFELIDNGYSFKVSKLNHSGYKHVLVRK